MSDNDKQNDGQVTPTKIGHLVRSYCGVCGGIRRDNRPEPTKEPVCICQTPLYEAEKDALITIRDMVTRLRATGSRLDIQHMITLADRLQTAVDTAMSEEIAAREG